MVDDETRIESVCGSMAIDCIEVPESTKAIMRECMASKKSFDDAVTEIIAQHLGEVDEQV